MVQLEEVALEVDRISGREQPEHADRLVQPATTRAGVHASVHDLLSILAPGADAQNEPAWSDPGERRELTGYGQGVPECQLIDADQDRHCWVGRQGERRRHDPVEALPALETQVVSDNQEVKAGVSGPLDEPAGRLRGLPEDRVVNVETDPDHRTAARGRRSSAAMTRFWISAVPSAIR